MKTLEIDTAFDFRSDAGEKDPDRFSPTLRRYHQLLWSKPLPDGTLFQLEDMGARGYLCHRSPEGDYRFSSDTVLRTFSRHRRMKEIVGQLDDADREDALHRGYTIGGMMLFPAGRVGRRQTINQARGTHAKIQDRFDLTLECIRRHYRAEASPLAEVLERYRDFFERFRDFRGDVEFFLLQDLVTDDFSTIRFWAPFDDFNSSPLPRDLASYLDYRTRMLQWIDSRNRRIAYRGTRMKRFGGEDRRLHVDVASAEGESHGSQTRPLRSS